MTANRLANGGCARNGHNAAVPAIADHVVRVAFNAD